MKLLVDLICSLFTTPRRRQYLVHNYLVGIRLYLSFKFLVCIFRVSFIYLETPSVV
jgi:hypothetical protein